MRGLEARGAWTLRKAGCGQESDVAWGLDLGRLGDARWVSTATTVVMHLHHPL